MQTHTVHSGDSLPRIAARYYGDATRWTELIAPNNLRPPYISTDPLDAYGDALAQTPLLADVASGARVLLVSRATLVRPGNTIVLLVTTSDGLRTIIAATVESVASGAITLTDGLGQTVRAGTTVRVHPTSSELRGTVAMPGSVLRIPDDSDTATTIALASETDNRYLRDLATADGRLLITNGDLALASGLANLRQQLTNRMRSESGALYQHPSYGNSAYSYLGQANGPTLALLVQAALAQCVADDPRVAAVERVEATATGDVVRAVVAVRAAQDTTAIALLLTR